MSSSVFDVKKNGTTAKRYQKYTALPVALTVRMCVILPVGFSGP
jgi:hypothetical protein